MKMAAKAALAAVKALAKGLTGEDEGIVKSIAIVAAVIMLSLLFFGILCMNMIGSVIDFDDEALVDEDFDIGTTDIYKDIDRVYNRFRQKMQETIDAREAQIIEENTTTETVEVEKEDGTKTTETRKVCTVTVVKECGNFSYSYLFAYINHSSKVMELEKYKFDEDEIYSVMETICTMEERREGDVFYLYTVIKTPEQVAAIYYADDEQKQDMYVESFDLYEEFLGFVQNSATAEQDGTAGSAGAYQTSMSEEDLQAILSNAPPDDEVAKKVLEFAASKLGVPYSQEHRTDGAHYDCSSLASYAYQAAGICWWSYPPTAAELGRYVASSGTAVSYDNLKPGDLIFYSSKANGRYMNITHVAIYAGNGMSLEASSGKGYVVHRAVWGRNQIVLCGRPYR